jgi:hypothetical protein
LSCLMPRLTCHKSRFSKLMISLTPMLIYHRLRVVTSLDSLPIQACSCLTAWTTEEASRPRIPRSTYAAARSSDRFQELFTQGFFSVCVFFHVRFLFSTPRAHPLGHGSNSALCALTCSVAESSGKHIRPGEDLWPHREEAGRQLPTALGSGNVGCRRVAPCQRHGGDQEAKPGATKAEIAEAFDRSEWGALP